MLAKCVVRRSRAPPFSLSLPLSLTHTHTRTAAPVPRYISSEMASHSRATSSAAVFGQVMNQTASMVTLPEVRCRVSVWERLW